MRLLCSCPSVYTRFQEFTNLTKRPRLERWGGRFVGRKGGGGNCLNVLMKTRKEWGNIRLPRPSVPRIQLQVQPATLDTVSIFSVWLRSASTLTRSRSEWWGGRSGVVKGVALRVAKPPLTTHARKTLGDDLQVYSTLKVIVEAWAEGEGRPCCRKRRPRPGHPTTRTGEARFATSSRRSGMWETAPIYAQEPP